MSQDLPDIAPPPEETMTIGRAPSGGWVVCFDGHVEAAFTTARDLAAWLEASLSPLDPQEQRHHHEPLPAMLSDPAQEQAPRRMWRIFRGGKS